MRNRLDFLKSLSVDLGMHPGQLLQIIETAPLRYKVFTIPKRDGSPRLIAQPAREVKAIQRWVVNDLGSVLPLHSSATAYRPGASIKKNAASHADSNFMLKMDFSNFFPTITFDDLVRHLSKTVSDRYDEGAIKLIAKVSTWAPDRKPPLRLCIGAPSSPLLSNSILYEFDRQINDFAATEAVTYTRYADDLTFSSKHHDVLPKFTDFVTTIAASLEYPSLRVNTKKTVFASRSGRRVVTGVTLTSTHELSVGRERKRLIRAMYHRFLRGLLTADEVERLKGLVSFVDNIEPGFAQRIRNQRLSPRDTI
jgi:retron-type reverse transcriptase